MSRRIDIELTSSREDGSWTWRAAGAREPRGTLEGGLLPGPAKVGDVLRVEIEGYLDALSITAVLPPRAPRAEPERLELKTSGGDQPLVTTALARGTAERGDRRDRRRNERGRDERDGRDSRDRRERGRGPRDRDRDRDREGGGGERREGGGDRRERRPSRDRQEARHDRPARPAPPPVETKPKPKRLRPGKTHRNAFLEAVPAEQRPIAEQVLLGGIPAVRAAIDKQNEELKAAGKPAVKADSLLKVAEDLRPGALAAVWRDRAEAAVALVDELDLRDLRSVVNAAGDAGRDEEARALAAQLREALTNRVEKEHAAWLADLTETVAAGRVVRALRLSSRPPKAGAPIPGDVATQLAEATAASLTEETTQDRWATVLDALAYSPVRRRVIPQSLPAKLSPDLRSTIARLASRLPEIAHIFAVEPDPTADRPTRGPRGDQTRRRAGTGGRKDEGQKRPRGDRGKGKPDKSPGPKSKRPETPSPTDAETTKSDQPARSPAAKATPEPEGTTPAAEATPEPEATSPAAEATPEPEATSPAAEATPEPEATSPVAEATPEPEATSPAAEATPESEATSPEAEVTPDPEATSPAAEATPEPATSSEPEATTPAAEVTPQPEVTSPAEATPEPEATTPAAEATPEPVTSSEPETTSPAAEATPEPETTSPEAEATPEPETSSESETTSPDAEATPEPETSSESETTSPEAEARPEPETSSEPEAKATGESEATSTVDAGNDDAAQPAANGGSSVANGESAPHATHAAGE